ncbi:Small_G-beta protein [Hexamita inflata]|uniref:Small G-beta protein n=1 Tax=Hexamita inflata TaxID=28002 RepID=A0AA86QU76_9EUKA|nr:Small G-beta protein [Hexamita inflata]
MSQHSVSEEHVEKPDISQPVQPCVRQLIQQIKQLHSGLRDCDPVQYSSTLSQALKSVPMSHSRTLRGHCAAVYACAWSSDSQRLASVGMDNNLIVWNPLKNSKLQVLPIQQPYTMSVRFAPDSSILAYGGLDCSVYLSNSTTPLYSHQGYVSCVNFLSSNKLVSTSADKTALVFDTQKNVLEPVFAKHFKDVMNVDVLNVNEFATASCDGFVRIFDLRSQQQVQIFSTLHADANCVKFHPNKQQVGVCTSANKALLFDRRTEHLLVQYQPEVQKSYLKQLQELKSLAFSKSGRIMFACGEANVYAFDVLFGTFLGAVGEHETQVTCVEVSPDGNALASASWDTLVKIWA